MARWRLIAKSILMLVVLVTISTSWAVASGGHNFAQRLTEINKDGFVLMAKISGGFEVVDSALEFEKLVGMDPQPPFYSLHKKVEKSIT